MLQCCLPADTAPPTTEQELASWLRQRLGERRVSEAPKKELSSLSNLFNFVPSQSPRSPQIWTSVVQSKLLSQTRRCQIYGSVVATTLLTLKMSSKSSAVVNIQSASTATGDLGPAPVGAIGCKRVCSVFQTKAKVSQSRATYDKTLHVNQPKSSVVVLVAGNWRLLRGSQW